MAALSLGFWILAATAIPAVVAALVAVLALRGSEPSERPAILRELAGVFTALSFRRPRSGTRSTGDAPVEDDRKRGPVDR
ncbi:hypothetical protein [Glycomyces xiaoerkulensis]|uniref:hypothetical protein n=1 Tax=Glycomyces xiaoerkulensis TaxID=2038139 RepID=UPI000C261644|nr:hypothetical protein [Glycomyces xiaoerkulensis]